MRHLFLLRHGLTTAPGRYNGGSDVTLTEEGWRQMSAAVEARSWQRVVSSPLRRCAHFASALAQRLAIPFAADARLREMDFGAWEGRSAVELALSEPAALRRFWRDPYRHGPPRAEPLAAVRARVLAIWNELMAAPDSERVLLVTHGGPMRILWKEFDFHPPAARLADIAVPYAVLWDTHALMSAASEASCCARC
jgi:alpha-ribazole phosphatase